MKKNVKDILLGLLDYFRFPELRNSWDGPFNGQKKRQLLFNDLVNRIGFEAVVETGTYRGTTSEFLFHETGSPIYTVENNSRLFGFSQMRFILNPKIIVSLMDSRDFLVKLSKKQSLINKKIFFYLDAHWNHDLPLAEEVKLIFKHWKKAIVMIDDFKVPFDNGYIYDNYGENKILNLAYLKIDNSHLYNVFFPTIPSDEETGEKRGCVILTQDSSLQHEIHKSEYFTQWEA